MAFKNVEISFNFTMLEDYTEGNLNSCILDVCKAAIKANNPSAVFMVKETPMTSTEVIESIKIIHKEF
jgi:hypothetical protein